MISELLKIIKIFNISILNYKLNLKNANKD